MRRLLRAAARVCASVRLRAAPRRQGRAARGSYAEIQTAFAVPVALAAQLVTAFTLAYGLGSPLLVAVLGADRQRGGLLAALGLFVLANAASALATDFDLLLAFRAAAGIGAGVYLALGIAAAAALSAPQQRGKAIAAIMGGMAGGTVLGVPLSLLLAERLGWASALWLVAALGGMALAGLACKLPALPAAPAVALKTKLSLLGDKRVALILTVSLWLLPAAAPLGAWLVMLPIAVWGAVGWALQVPQNNSLLQAREKQHDGNLAVALNKSALYLGSAIGAAAGGALLLQQWPPALLAACTGAVAGIGTLVQWFVLRRES